MTWKDNTWGVQTLTAEDGTKIKCKVSNPSVPAPSKLTQEDVWGKVDFNYKTGKDKRISKGMIVASQAKGYPDKCPVWHDNIPKKSVTVICTNLQEPDVEYWLDYVLGAHSVSKRKSLPKGKLALRADYKCW